MSVKRILCLLLALAAFLPAFGQNLSVDYKAEIPAIRKAYDAFKGDRFDIVSIACSDKREDTIDALGEQIYATMQDILK